MNDYKSYNDMDGLPNEFEDERPADFSSEIRHSFIESIWRDRHLDSAMID